MISRTLFFLFFCTLHSANTLPNHRDFNVEKNHNMVNGVAQECNQGTALDDIDFFMDLDDYEADLVLHTRNEKSTPASGWRELGQKIFITLMIKYLDFKNYLNKKYQAVRLMAYRLFRHSKRG